jgi:hypothetical protein
MNARMNGLRDLEYLYRVINNKCDHLVYSSPDLSLALSLIQAAAPLTT